MTVRLTVAQALVRFLSAQYSERDGGGSGCSPACFGIFGHGNVAGLGQALLQAELEDPEALPYILARNEQAMVHTAVRLRPHPRPAADLCVHGEHRARARPTW